MAETLTLPGAKNRTSLILQKNVDRNAAVVCAVLGISKNQYIEKLIEEDLKKRGIDPGKPPALKRFSDIQARADVTPPSGTKSRSRFRRNHVSRDADDSMDGANPYA